MNVLKFDTEEAWLEARRGRITGTRVKTLFSKRDGKPLKGFYEVIAERLAVPRDGENPMDRGKRLEDEAIERFSAETGKKVDTSLVLWTRDDDDSIALSPDGVVVKPRAKKVTEACEVKCLSSASHIEAFLTQTVPDEYEHQVLQYFIVNEDLETLFFLFYDPSMPRDFFYLTIRREDVQEDVDTYLYLEKRALTEFASIAEQLTF